MSRAETPQFPQDEEPTPTHATEKTNALSGKGIAGAAMIVMLFFVLSRASGLLREMIVAAQFGTSSVLEAYLAAFRIPDLLFQLVAGGALGSAFIPTFSQVWGSGDRARAWLLFSRVLNLVTLLMLIFAGLAAFFAEPLVARLIAPGFAPEQQLLTARLMRWMLLGTVVFGAGGLIMGALNAVQHFLLPAVAPLLYNVAIILGAWLLAPTMGIYGLVVGIVCGAFAHFLIQIPGLTRYGARYYFSWSIRDDGVREVGRLMGPRVLGLFFVQLHFLVNTILASGLPTGSLSALNYAWLIMLLPQGIFAQAIATAVFPTFAAQVAANHHDEMRRTFGQTLRAVLFLTIPAAVGLYLLRVPLIQLLLQRGEFDLQSTHLVAAALQFYAVGLVAHSAVEILVRAFYALHDTRTPVSIGVAAMILNILLSLLLVERLSFGGLALANSTATTIEMLILVWLLRRRMGGIDGKALGASVVRNALAASIMGLTLWGWLRWLAGSAFAVDLLPSLLPWVSALGGLAIAIVAYLGVSLLLKSEELKPVLALLARRLVH